jgi:outer membrane lipoprotein-sorting protein
MILPRRPFLALIAAAFVAAAAAVPSARPAAAAEPASPAEIAAAEAYLNGIKTLEAKFIQGLPDGSVMTGTFYLSRPGRLRFSYDPPVDDFIVADGRFLFYWDARLKQQSNAPIGSTLADFILRDSVAFSGDVKLVKAETDSGLLRITLTPAEDAALGRLTLVFTQSPLALRQWQVVDAQGSMTEVTLNGLRTGQTLAADLFRFRDPSKKKDDLDY